MESVVPHQHNTLFSTIFPFIFRGPLHFAFAFLAVRPGSRAARRHTRRTFFFVSIVDHKFCRRPRTSAYFLLFDVKIRIVCGCGRL